MWFNFQPRGVYHHQGNLMSIIQSSLHVLDHKLSSEVLTRRKKTMKNMFLISKCFITSICLNLLLLTSIFQLLLTFPSTPLKEDVIFLQLKWTSHLSEGSAAKKNQNPLLKHFMCVQIQLFTSDNHVSEKLSSLHWYWCFYTQGITKEELST